MARETGPRRVLIPTTQAAAALQRAGFRDYPKAVLHGSTAHFNVYYSRPLGTVGQRIAGAVLSVCERDYARISRIFGVATPAGLPINIILADLSPARAYHYGNDATTLYCGVKTTPAVVPAFSSFLALTQLVEVFEASQGQGWDCGASNGEGLSRVLATERYPRQIMGFATAAAWLNEGRPDFVNRTDPTDRNPISTGCAVLFLNYLRHQLNYRWRDIVAAAGPTLSMTYLRLTGDASNPFPSFAALLASRFPAGRQAVFKVDNPFPIGPGRPGHIDHGAVGGAPAEADGETSARSLGQAEPAHAEEADWPADDVIAEVDEDIEVVAAQDEPGTEWPGAYAEAFAEPFSVDSPAPGAEVDEGDPAPAPLKRASGRFIGHKNTHIFHPATSANLPSEGNRVYFESEDEAIAAGFRRAERESRGGAGS